VPALAGRDLFTLHQEGVGVDEGAGVHPRPVVDEGFGGEGHPVPEHDVIGLEGAVLE